MSRSGKARHVRPDLGQQHPGSRLADAGHRHQMVGRRPKWRENLAHTRLHLAHSRLDGVNLAQVELE